MQKFPCTTCNGLTVHKPTPMMSNGGLKLICTVCAGESLRMSRDELIQKWTQLLAAEPPLEVSAVDTTQVRVYVNHHLGEAELPADMLREHVRLTGKIPSVGEKVMALPKGLSHKAFAIPIYEVVRIEQTKP